MKKYLRPVAILLPILFFIPMYQLSYPNKSPQYFIDHQETFKALGQLRWEDGKDHALPQDYADMLGWKEMALKVDLAYESLPTSSKTIVICDNYGQAGAINYYTNNRMKAVSFNADYVNWFDLTNRYDNLIRVKDYSKQDDELQETGPYFTNSKLIDSVNNRYAREYGTRIYGFSGAKVDIRKRLADELKQH